MKILLLNGLNPSNGPEVGVAGIVEVLALNPFPAKSQCLIGARIADPILVSALVRHCSIPGFRFASGRLQFISM